MSDFKVITYKKRSKTTNKSKECSKSQVSSCNNETIDINSLIKRIKSAKDDIVSSTFYEHIIQNLRKSSKQLEKVDIVSFGLGRFSECISSRYQFAFLLGLQDLYGSEVFIYDPIFTCNELAILKHFNCNIIEANEEGKRLANCDTIFFLPHCPKQLINNLLWSNWGKNLDKCVIIGNSFEKILESHSDRVLKNNLSYVFYASQFVIEQKIDNCFKFSDIFNDLSIHFFFQTDINSLEESLLNLKEEPVYIEEEIEFVKNC